jgi:hypothetical protein
MAIRVIEQPEARGYTTDWRGVKTFPRAWVVEADEVINEVQASDALNAKDASSILYGEHPAWPWAVCRKVTAKGSKSGKQFYISAEYSTEPFPAAGVGSATGDSGGGGGGAGGSEKPSPAQSNSAPANTRPPTVSIDSRPTRKALEFHVGTSDPVINTAGDKFDPAVEVNRSPHVITWRFHRSPAQLNWATRSLFQDSVNLQSFTLLGRTYPAETLWCSKYAIEPVWETGPAGMEFLWAVTVIAEEDPDGWNAPVLNTGRNKLVSIGGGNFVRQAITDRAGQPVAEAVPLDEDSVPVIPGDPYHYVDVIRYVARSWANLLA